MTKQKHFYLIRGLIREKGHWGPFIDHLKGQFSKAQVTTIDIPGAGDYHKASSPLSIRGMVEGMRQDYLKAKTQNENSHLVAISLGGMIAVEWMKAYPGDFDEATLINTSFGGISPLFHRLLPSAFLFLLKVPVLKGRKKESRILELVTNHKHIFNETLDMWEMIGKERPVSLENTFRQLIAGACFNLLAATNDRMVSVHCSRAIARKWNLRLEEHPTAGHDLTVDDPEWVAKKIKEHVPA